MSNISQEQWQAIEQELQNYFCRVKFQLKGHSITATRERVSESKTEIAIYVNGAIKGEHIAETELPEPYASVWQKRTRSKYKKSFIDSIEKIYGKREAKKQHPNLHDKIEYYWPSFTSAKTLVRQFKKIDGLQLVTEL